MYTERMVEALFDVRTNQYVIAYQLFIEGELTPVKDSCRVVTLTDAGITEVKHLADTYSRMVELRRMLPIWCQRQISEAVNKALSESS